jgi:putative salt-induced outer membrane protein YdiY
VTRRLFVTVPRVELYTDRFQNLEYRLTASLPVGYEVLDTDRHDWRLSLGPAYQLTRLDTVLPGQDSQDGTFAVTVASQYAWDMTDSVDLEFDYAITAPLPDTEEYNHNLVLRLSVDLVANLQLDVAFVWDRVNEPIADGDGLLPEPDDYRTTIGLGWSF